MFTVRHHLYALAFLDEVGPFMTLYALWFANHGLTVDQVSLLFALWAAVTLVAEVPTGVLADWLDRRVVLMAGVALRALGIVVFLLFPSMTGFAVGAALWAVQVAGHSGVWEAVVHDALAATDEADAYETVIARCGQFNQMGIALGTGLAAVLMAVGVSLASLGWATVALSPLLWVGLGSLSAAAHEGEPEDDEPAGLLATLSAGLAQVRHTRELAWLLMLGAVLESVFVLDEYMPSLAVAVKTPPAAVPLLVLCLWVGLVVGGEVVARRPGLPLRVLGAAMGLGALVGLVGLSIEHPLGACLLAIPYATMNMAWIGMDARLQAQVAGASRATVGSARSFVGALGNLLVFAAFGIAIADADPTPGLAICLASVVVLGLAMWGVLPVSSPAQVTEETVT